MSLSTAWTYCTSGVPQGSIPGPLLFSMMVNSYASVERSTQIILYADDLIILHHVAPNKKDNSQSEIENLQVWC